MVIADMPSVRAERVETSRLAWAFVLSLIVHLVCYSGYEAGRKLGWWQNLQWPAWLSPAKLMPGVFKKKENLLQPKPLAQPQVREVPLMFVDVNPAVATPEPPPNAKYYSALNSRAANPQPDKNTDTPKIEGKRTEVLRTEDVPRSVPAPPQPLVAAPQKAQEEQEEQKAQSTKAPGDLAMAKPAPKAKEEPDPGTAPQSKPSRPRTLAEARARLPANMLAGEKTKMEGGVNRRGVTSSLDARATAFGAYDAAIVRAVQDRWYSLLDNRGWAADRTGKVTLRFHLNADGTVSKMEFVENTVDLALGMLCQSAITDSTPFPPWPSDMRREIGANFRDVTFTFYYY